MCSASSSHAADGEGRPIISLSPCGRGVKARSPRSAPGEGSGKRGLPRPVDESEIVVQWPSVFPSRFPFAGAGRHRRRRQLAEEMDVSETTVVHLAISRFVREVLPAYEMDDGSLTVADIKHIRKVAQPMLPKGKVLNARSLL